MNSGYLNFSTFVGEVQLSPSRLRLVAVSTPPRGQPLTLVWNYAKMARFLLIKLPASMAWIKQRTAEYRISNRRISKGGFAALNLFIKSIEYIPSTFDIHDSIFDILFLINPARSKFLFRLDQPFFWPAARLNPEPLNG